MKTRLDTAYTKDSPEERLVIATIDLFGGVTGLLLAIARMYYLHDTGDYTVPHKIEALVLELRNTKEPKG